MTVLGTPADLRAVDIDTYVVAGSTDHIVPWRAAYRTTQLTGGETEFVLSSSGHIQAMVNPPGNPKSSYRTANGTPPADADEWLATTDEHRGTWWDHWVAWLQKRSSGERPAPTTLRQRVAPAAGTRARPLRPPGVTTASGGRLLTFARVDGHLLRVSMRGEGRPLLLVMGLGGNIEMWRPLEDALVQHGIQTIAYDAPGTGESPPRLVPLRVPGLARQAAHLLDVLGIPEADVLGVSFGGAVAQQLALDNPHRVRRLVLASTSVGLGGVPGHPLALALLATPLRYYSPSFFRRTAQLLYGPLDTDGDGRAAASAGERAPSPTADDVGIREPAHRGSRLDEPPLAAPDPHAGARPLGRRRPDRPAGERAHPRRAPPQRRTGDRARCWAPAPHAARADDRGRASPTSSLPSRSPIKRWTGPCRR